MEKVFLKEEGVEVTSARLIVGDAVYAMSKVVAVEKVKWSRTGMYVLVVLWVAMIMVGVFIADAGGTAMLGGGAVMVTGVWGLLLGARMWRSLRHVKSVDVWIEEEEYFSIFWSQDDAAVDRVYKAISAAIAANADGEILES